MIWSLLISLFLFWQIPSPAAQVRNDTDPVIPSEASSVIPSEAKESQEDIDIAEIIFDHIGDDYEWHILTWGDKHVILHLPVIVHSSTGWHVFSSKHLEHGESYEGLVIDPEKGKIVEVDSGKRPFDISITKNVLSLMMSCLLLLVVILCTARWYRKHDVLNEAPTGIAALMEPLVMMVHDMARENIGEEDYRKYSPYLCMAFLFILLNNFMGIVPFFPGGANLTGNIAITLVLALCTFFTVNLTGTKHYYKDIFAPDVPGFLKPIMPVIEVFSALMKPVSLSSLTTGSYMSLTMSITMSHSITIWSDSCRATTLPTHLNSIKTPVRSISRSRQAIRETIMHSYSIRVQWMPCPIT